MNFLKKMLCALLLFGAFGSMQSVYAAEEAKESAADDINIRDEQGCTAFYRACEEGNLPQVRRLLNKGANPNIFANGVTPFYAACSRGHLEVVRFLAGLGDRVNIEQADNEGRTPFYIACENGRKDIVAYFIQELGFNVGFLTEMADYYWTPFIEACAGGHSDIVQLFIEEFPDSTLKDFLPDPFVES